MRVISNFFAFFSVLFVLMTVSTFMAANGGEYSASVSQEFYALTVIEAFMAFGCVVGFFFYRDCVWFAEEADAEENESGKYTVTWEGTASMDYKAVD